MSNFLAPATVTAVLQRVLQAAVSADVPGATVTTDRPLTASATPKAAVNVYCYMATPNPHLRNADLPTRNGGGQLVQRPEAALDLHYLVSCYGDDTQLEPQRLLGSVARTLHAFPVVTRDLIADVVAAASTPTNPTHPYLRTTDLGSQTALVRVTPQLLSLEELSRLWSVFPEIPYTLSAAYQASVVLIEQDVAPPAPAPPVRVPNVFVSASRGPVVRSVASAAGPDQPILATSSVLVRGAGLGGPDVRVRLLGTLAVPDRAGDQEIEVALPAVPPDVLRAGAQPLQVVEVLPLGPAAEPHVVAQSDVASFALHPTVVSVASSPPVATGGTFSATLHVELDVVVGTGQRAALLLGDVTDAAGVLTHVFAAPPRTADASALDVPVSGLGPGEYVVRISVDGAESPRQVDAAHTVSFP